MKCSPCWICTNERVIGTRSIAVPVPGQFGGLPPISEQVMFASWRLTSFIVRPTIPRGSLVSVAILGGFPVGRHHRGSRSPRCGRSRKNNGTSRLMKNSFSRPGARNAINKTISSIFKLLFAGQKFYISIPGLCRYLHTYVQINYAHVTNVCSEADTARLEKESEAKSRGLCERRPTT